MCYFSWKAQKITFLAVLTILYDIPKYQRDKLQRIQNTAARMITGARSSDHITPLLKSLHWLPVEARIHFKILLITYKILNGQSAGYLEPLIKDHHPSRALRIVIPFAIMHPSHKIPNIWRTRVFHCSTSLMEHYPRIYQKCGQRYNI